MKQRSAFFIALRYLWGRAKEGGRYLRGAAAGIAVSLIPIIVTLIVADGMIKGITDRYLELGTGHVQIFDLFGSGDSEYIIGTLSEMEGIRGIWQEKRGTGVLAGKAGRTGVTVRAIEPSFWEDPGSARYLHIIDGELTAKAGNDIVLGETLASDIGAQIGDTVRLMTVNTSGGMPSPRSAAFTVRGIISCGYSDLDAFWCIINLDGADRVLTSDASSCVIAKLDDPYTNADNISWDIYLRLGGGFSVYSWKDLLRSQYASYETQRQLLLFIMALIVIVAAINVSSATSMLALERQRDIAILKISGAGVGGVARIFLWGSFLTGLAGALLGIACGLLVGININALIRSVEKILSFFSSIFNGTEVKILDPGFYLETIPIIVDRTAVFLIGCFAILCSILASWIPARRAGKLKPMDLLRKT